ncbi:MAG: GNAT family N-acetyltransferase [Myxococcales bacterium]|nr:GNAT family N-acetyltransferase [Myxococcales bacterium]
MIRRGGPADHPWVIEEGTYAYADLGDYRRILPSWLTQPGVLVFLDEDVAVGGAPVRRGFAMLGFYLEPNEHGESQPIADLLALAVAPPYQRLGIGKQLLQHVIATTARVAEHSKVWELRLTVAGDNTVAQRMYERAGFVRASVLASTYYERGQLAVRMVRSLAGR